MLGICNGFQVLLEAGLLPGAMLRNRDLKFRCEHVCVRIEQIDTPFTQRAASGQVLQLPIAHGEGNYFADPAVVSELESSGRIVFRYCDAAGTRHRRGESQRLGQRHRRHLQRARNVVGLMPHPERACERCSAAATGASCSNR